jgi:cytoskeleton protein RodZ
MPGATEEPRPWNEGAALEELEHLKRGIDECRRRRKELQAEFDGFVRSFRTPAREVSTSDAVTIRDPPAADRQPPLPMAAPANAVMPTAVLPAAARPLSQAGEVAVPAILAPQGAESPRHRSSPVSLAWRSMDPRTRRAVLGTSAAAVLVVGVAGVFLMRPEPRAPQGTTGRGPSQAADASRHTAQPIVAPGTAQSITDAGPPPSEIVAERRVWVRVVVDGVKTVERELGAGEHVALPAGASLVIRAGNAGAIRVRVHGQDRGLLGAEGEVVTRTLRIPVAPAR